MQPIDWAIVVGLLAIMSLAALSTRRHTRSVAAFLAADRAGGRYLICVALNVAAIGVITYVNFFQQNYEIGFTAIWWGFLEGPAWILMALSGWVVYRYRQTRAMTLAQFLEMRYSRSLRVFAGLVAFLAGIINFGIFPSVGAYFFIALCSLPAEVYLLGCPLSTYTLVMAFLLGTSLTFTFLGGQVAVMVTDFLQGVFVNVVSVAVMIFLLVYFSWDQISDVLLEQPAGESLVDPFDIGEESHFNVWFFLISIAIMVYGPLLWQGTSGYNCSAKDAHEAKMANLLGNWRYRVLILITLLTPICARTFLEHPDFAEEASVVTQRLEAVETGGEEERTATQNQLRIPLFFAAILPAGLMGLLVAAMLAAFISTHDTYLHSWGSIFVQDCILPFRKRPLSTRQHLWLLRLAILGVAVFIFWFSHVFHTKTHLAMWMAVTGAIFIGGAGILVIGGLYWKRGTTPAAWAALFTGMIVSGLGAWTTQNEEAELRAGQDNPLFGWLHDLGLWMRENLDLTGQEYSFWAIIGSIAVYTLVSLLGPRRAFDMDRLLHRGRHAVEGETAVDPRTARTWLEKLGLSREFKGWDKFVALITIAWPLTWTVVFLVGTLYNLSVDLPSATWLEFWRWYTWITFAAMVVVTIWFAIGGTFDLRFLYRKLRAAHTDERDDGRVQRGDP